MTAVRALLAVLISTLVGVGVGLLVVLVQGPCLQTDICVLRPDGSCAPGPCDDPPLVPDELLLFGTFGLIAGIAVATCVALRADGERRRARRRIVQA